MAYVGADGKVVDRRSNWRLSIITDFFAAIWSFFALFFAAITNPEAVKNNQRSTYGQRHQGQSYRRSDNDRRRPGSNIRGVNRLGAADAKMAGG